MKQNGFEPTPHKKKRQKRRAKKSDHKHDYREVIGISDYQHALPFPLMICRICGKRKLGKMFYFEKCEDGPFYRMLSMEEVKEKHPELEVVFHEIGSQ